MKLSQESQEVLFQLNALKTKRTWFRQTEKSEAICQLLKQLAALGDPAALPYVAKFLSSSDRDILQAARHTVASLISRFSPHELLQIEDPSFWNAPYYVSDEWTNISPADVATIAGDQNAAEQVAVLGLLSFHKNGYVRQEAVRRLSKLNSGSEFPFLLIRQNDWVSPIAKEAQEIVATRMDDVPIPSLVACLNLIFHLNRFSRHDHSETVRRTVDLLLDEQHDSILRDLINSPERNIRRSVVRYGLERTGTHQSRLILYGLESDDPIIRLNCCRGLLSAYEGNDLVNILETLKADPFMSVRREAFLHAAEFFPDIEIEGWQQALLDRSRSIRDLARYQLAKLGPSIAIQYYRDAVRENPESLPAVEGMADAGDETDLDFFRTLLQHRFPSRRCAAIRGLVRVMGESSINEVLPLIDDISPRVIRTVQKSLAPYLYCIPAEKLYSFALKSQILFARCAALESLADQGKWCSFPWLLKAVAEAEAETAKYAESMLIAWCSPPKCNHAFIKPSEEEKQAIAQALTNGKERVSANIIHLVENELLIFK
ncbi:MAG: hypothetical protein QM501_07780 [Gimesia sp.]